VLLLATLAAGCSLAVPQDAGPVIQPGAAGRVMRSTVDVQVRGETDGLTIEQGIGTGVVFNREGVIVTNDHVVDLRGEPVDGITVRTIDGRTARARVIARFPGLDLAFLQADLGGLRPARFVWRLDRVAPGHRVLAVGAPHHFRKPVLRGRILHVLEDVRVQGATGLRSLLESSVRLHRGFSGGPLADARGRVVGVNMAISPRGDGASTSLAIPAAVVLEAAAEAGLRPSR
jgi:S1-C subfamily serine protease